MAKPPLDWTELSEHSQGLTRLAASLLSDVHGGEDLAQEAVLRALVAERSSQPIRSGAAWLRKTVRRLAANEWRGRARRSQREEAVARPEAIPSSEEVLERAELSRWVLDALDGLPELYARSLRDHFIGGLAVEQMAERDGVSIHTVRSRLYRGKAALRSALDSAENSGASHWRLALAPLAIPTPRTLLASRTVAQIALVSEPTTTLGFLIVMKKFALLAACVVAGFLGLKAMTPPAGLSETQVGLAAEEPGEIDSAESISQPRSVDATLQRSTVEGKAPHAKGDSPTTTVTGRVVGSDLAPIEGVRVGWEGNAWIDHEKTPVRSVTTVTDVNGRYVVELLHKPNSAWSAEFRGTPFQTSASLRSNARESADLPVLAPGRVEAPTVTLGPAGAARGRVVDEEERPIANALVRIGPSKNGTTYALLPEAETRSDVEGRFLLGHVAVGSLGIAVSAEGFATAYLPDVTFEEGTIAELGDIAVEKSKRITGTILDELGKPIAGQAVRASSQEEHSVSTSATTDPEGGFELILKSNASHRLWIEREGYASIGAVGFKPVTVDPGASDLQFQLEPLPSWTFKVVDAEGEPIERFRLRLVLGGGSQAESQVYSSGGSRSQSLHPGGVQTGGARAGEDLVRVRAEGYLPFEGDVQPDLGSTEQQTIRLSKGAVLRGRVMHGDAPIIGASVTGLGRRRFGLETAVTAKSDEEGRYVLRGFDAGEVSISARSTDQSLTAAATIRIDSTLFHGPGQAPEVKVDDLQLQGRGSIEGTVSLPSGVAPDGLEVYVGDWKGATRFPLRSDGSFLITDVEVGVQSVSLTERPGSIDKVPPARIEVKEGEVSFVQIDATKHGISRLDIKLEVPGYAPGDVHVQVVHGVLDPIGYPRSRSGIQPRCDGQGEVTLWPRASGAAHLELRLPDAPSIVLLNPELILTPGSTESLHVTVELGSLEVELPAGVDLAAPGVWRLRLFRPGIPHSLADWRVTKGEPAGNEVRPVEGICSLGAVPEGSFELRLEVFGPDSRLSPTHTVPVTVERGVSTRVAFPRTR